MTSMRWLALVLIVAMTVAGVGCFHGPKPNSSGEIPKPGKPAGTAPDANGLPTSMAKPGNLGKPAAVWTGNAQDFEVAGFDGKAFKISDYAGQPVVLNFWAAWCGPCKAEFPDFQAAYNEKKGQFVMISVAYDDEQDPVKFAQDSKYNWIFAHDTDGAKRYGVKAIPHTFFISRTGDIVDQQKGMMTRDQFETKLAKIL
jgi:thiol-disulfide isomerase/thioredoxin